MAGRGGGGRSTGWLVAAGFWRGLVVGFVGTTAIATLVVLVMEVTGTAAVSMVSMVEVSRPQLTLYDNGQLLLGSAVHATNSRCGLLGRPRLGASISCVSAARTRYRAIGSSSGYLSGASADMTLIEALERDSRRMPVPP